MKKQYHWERIKSENINPEKNKEWGLYLFNIKKSNEISKIFYPYQDLEELPFLTSDIAGFRTPSLLKIRESYMNPLDNENDKSIITTLCLYDNYKEKEKSWLEKEIMRMVFLEGKFIDGLFKDKKVMNINEIKDKLNNFYKASKEERVGFGDFLPVFVNFSNLPYEIRKKELREIESKEDVYNKLGWVDKNYLERM